MLTHRHSISDDEQWAPVSDLMAVIMLVFMLISMILFVSFDLEKRSNIDKCTDTRSMLGLEFQDDFEKWGAILEEDLTIRFTNQRVLFEVNSSKIELGGWFSMMLGDFFPRYMNIINEIRNKFGKKEVLAIRIEGHTSSEYSDLDVDAAYIKNMELSQDRARNILGYVLVLPESINYKNIARPLLTANGLSSSKLVLDDSGDEDKESSRRVEFKLLTNACQKAGVYDERIG